MATLERLRPLVERAEHVVPGHGPVSGAAEAARVLEEDLAYLEDLRRRGERAELPAGGAAASSGGCTRERRGALGARRS